MQALVCSAHGPASQLTLGELPNPTPKANEVLIDVHAAGVNFPDALIIAGKYQFQPPLPFAPGGEAAGTIAAMGDKVKGLSVGQKVMALTGWGSFAEQVAVPFYNVLPIPEGMDFATAASFAMTYGTAMHALTQRGQLKAGETLLVLGAGGGVGLAAVEIGKALGANVIACASSAEKLAAAQAAGADLLLNYQTEPFKESLKQLTAGKGVDVVFDPVGADLLEPAFRAMAWNGRYLVIGFAGGPIPALPANLPLLKGAALIGVFWGMFAQRQPEENAANFQQLFAWYAQGTVKPLISQRFPLSQAGQAIAALAERKALGKLVVEVR